MRNAVENCVSRKPSKARKQQNKLVSSQIYFNPKQSIFYVCTADNLPEMWFHWTVGSSLSLVGYVRLLTGWSGESAGRYLRRQCNRYLPPSRSNAATTGTYKPPNFFLNKWLLSMFSKNFLARDRSIMTHSIAAGRTLLSFRAVQSSQSCSVELLLRFRIGAMWSGWSAQPRRGTAAHGDRGWNMHCSMVRLNRT